MPAAAPADWGTMVGAAAAPSGPAYGTLSALQTLVDQQRAYIDQLEKHVAALDAYIATLRGGKH